MLWRRRHQCLWQSAVGLGEKHPLLSSSWGWALSYLSAHSQNIVLSIEAVPTGQQTNELTHNGGSFGKDFIVATLYFHHHGG